MVAETRAGSTLAIVSSHDPIDDRLEDARDLPEVAVAHVSDTHLGYEAYAARSATGNNQRGEDVVRAFHRAVEDICSWDPPLVIHSGDVAERPQVSIRYMLAIRSELSRLAGIRPDGTRRQLVVIAGNHDASRHLKEGCFQELYRGLPGVHVITTASREITFDPAVHDCDPVLAHVAVTAVPHDSLRLPEVLADARPRRDKISILTTHGVAEGSELFVRAIGREYPIPADLLVRDWDYVALGHWHVQGPVGVAGATAGSRVWYAGSTEHIDFSDVKGSSGTERAWLAVTVRPGQGPLVDRRTIPVRPMVNLPAIDAADLTPDDIGHLLVERLKTDIDGAVVRQRVKGPTRDIWALVDTAAARAAASAALHYRIDTTFAQPAAADTGTDDEPRHGLGDIGRLLVERAVELVPEPDRDAALSLARTLLGSVLDADAGIDDTTPTADTADRSVTGTDDDLTESVVDESPQPQPLPATPTPTPPAPSDPRAAFAALNAELGITTLDEAGRDTSPGTDEDQTPAEVGA